jgi:Predicted membrane protein
MNNTHPRVTGRRQGPRHQKGAAAVFVAIVLVALVGIIVVGIDIGRLYYGQRSLQRDANLAALEGARALGGCNNGGVVGTSAQVTSAVQNSLTTNLARGGPGDPGYGSPLSLLSGVNGAPPVEIGTTTTQGTTRLFVPGSASDRASTRCASTSRRPCRPRCCRDCSRTAAFFLHPPPHGSRRRRADSRSAPRSPRWTAPSLPC